MPFITNTQRNEMFAHILSSDFNVCQMKFLLYLYNTTICVQRASLCIPNLSKFGESFGFDRSNFFRDIKQLCDNDVVICNNKRYSINMEYDIWHTDKKALTRLQKHMGKDINKQLTS